MIVMDVRTIVEVKFDAGELNVNATASYSGAPARYAVESLKVQYPHDHLVIVSKLLVKKLKKDGKPWSRPAEWIWSWTLSPESQERVSEIVWKLDPRS